MNEKEFYEIYEDDSYLVRKEHGRVIDRVYLFGLDHLFVEMGEYQETPLYRVVLIDERKDSCWIVCSSQNYEFADRRFRIALKNAGENCKTTEDEWKGENAVFEFERKLNYMVAEEILPVINAVQFEAKARHTLFEAWDKLKQAQQLVWQCEKELRLEREGNS